MSVRKLADGRWIADFYTASRSNGRDGGRGRGRGRGRRKFTTKGEALAFENYLRQKTEAAPWRSNGKDRRRLSDIIQLWFERHGIALRDGEKRKSAMLWAAQCMGSPLATEFTAALFTHYRAKRLEGQFARTQRVTQVSPRTMNLEHAYFQALFNELRRLGEWSAPNPLEHVRPFRTDDSEMHCLTAEQIDKLLEACRQSSAKDLCLIVKICLATGARWSEAETLKR